MKKVICSLMLIFVVFALCGCSQTSLDKNAPVTLTFIYGEENITVQLPDEEAAKVIEILDGNSYDSSFGAPSCGFDKNISIKVADQVFAIARDTCKYVQDLDNLKYFNVSQEDIEYIHSLFEKYGGYFPCI